MARGRSCPTGSPLHSSYSLIVGPHLCQLSRLPPPHWSCSDHPVTCLQLRDLSVLGSGIPSQPFSQPGILSTRPLETGCLTCCHSASHFLLFVLLDWSFMRTCHLALGHSRMALAPVAYQSTFPPLAHFQSPGFTVSLHFQGC